MWGLGFRVWGSGLGTVRTSRITSGVVLRCSELCASPWESIVRVPRKPTP